LNSHFLFHSRLFLENQGDFRLFSAGALKEEVELAVFRVSAHLCSPMKAPFGSFAFRGNPDPLSVITILNDVEKWAFEHKIPSFSMVLPPDCYQETVNSWLKELLLSMGYTVAWHDMNYHLKIQQLFTEKLHRSERWKLNRSVRKGFSFRLIPDLDWDFAYPFFLESRTRKGYSLSMSREDLEHAFQMFPKEYRAWGVFHDQCCLAMAITVRVSPIVEYIFYTADDLAFRRFSPVVMLHCGIFSQCQQEGVEILDLGTSSLKGIINQGVFDFKRNLGASLGWKSTFRKEFQSRF